MSRLEKVIESVRERSAVEVSQPKAPSLTKSISLARARLNSHQSDDLEKGVHDAMYHHALHARAAHSASYKAGPHDPEHDKKCKEHGKKHEYMFLKHALDNAHKKSKYQGDTKYKMQRSMEYFDSEAPYSDDDPDYKKACEHYKGGGGFKGHKEDKED